MFNFNSYSYNAAMSRLRSKNTIIT